MKRLFLLLALVGMIATSCEDSGIEEPSNPTEQPDDNTDEEQPGDDENTDEEQPGGDDNTDEEQPGDGENEDDGELPVFEIDGPGKYTIGAEGGSIEVVVTTNLEYRLEVSEDAQSWLTIADTRAVRTERLTISVSPNNTDSERTATISVFDGADNKVFSFTLTQEYVNPDEIIKFVDNTAKTICIVNWDTNGDAELSISEAVAVTDIGTKFQSKDIIAFDEFKYFTGVTTIVTEAFKDCANLVKISIPDSVTTIGDSAFSGCSSLTSVTIPDGVTTIGEKAFYDCSSLTSITIPGSVTTIGYSAFYSCDSLTSVTIPDSVTTIGNEAFYGCSSLTEFNGKFASEDGRYLIIDGVLKSFAPYGLTEYAIPNSVTTIARSAFSGCASLTSVAIPDSVTSIGERAFSGCSSLTSVYCKALTPPTAVDHGYWGAFDNNASARKFYVPTESVVAYKSAYGWGNYAYAIVGYDFEKDEIVEVQPNNEIWYTSSDGKVVRPYFTEVFGAIITSNIYYDGKGIITFDGNVTEIGYRAFFDCDSLTSITIPESVTTIGGSAFSWCDDLTSITIPDSVTTIGNYAFDSCVSLTSITIPDSVTEIGVWAFENCYSLRSVTIPDGVTTIGDSAFYSCNGLTSVTIGDSVTSISSSAFYNCDSLTEFKGSGASSDGLCIINNKRVLLYFLGKTLTEYIIPDGVTSIGERAFLFCSSLTSVTIPDSVTLIGGNAFSWCDSLTSITIPDSVTEIGEGAFSYCDSLTSITIPDGVTTIGGWAFFSCDSLTSVYCKATTPPSLGYDVFDDNHSDRKIYVPTGSVNAYKSATYWSNYASAIVGYDFENGVVVE